MIDVKSVIAASPEQVWAVLADGWTYSGWVVGASHVRDVDPGWPAVGTRIHHSVGPWPLVVNDSTEVVTAEPGKLLELDARLWPMGAARVRIELTRNSDGGTDVLMSEQVVRGPSSIVPKAVQALLLVPRNRESLSRLCDLATGAARHAA